MLQKRIHIPQQIQKEWPYHLLHGFQTKVEAKGFQIQRPVESNLLFGIWKNNKQGSLLLKSQR